MSIHFKLIVPLLDSIITKDDLSEKTGFIGAYSKDINRPYLDNHVFLLYAYNVLTNEAFKTWNKLRSSKNLYSVYKFKVKGVPFIMFAFTIIGKSIKNIMNDSPALSKEERMRIISFWNLQDVDINEYMLNPLYVIYSKFVNNVVPEEDYEPEVETFWNEKSGALQYRSVPL